MISLLEPKCSHFKCCSSFFQKKNVAHTI